jgi:3-methyladenine DNA glycosylase AlkD
MINEIQSSFQKSKNPEIASGMKAYMKDNFDYLGIKSPERKTLQKQFVLELKKWNIDLIWDLVLKLWELDEREYQYFAMDLIKWRYKKPTKEDLEIIRHLITTKSWWDSVDFLAAHTLGKYLFEFPEKKAKVCNTFIKSNNLWLQRSTLIFQLKYKNHTDTALLQKNILSLNNNRDFFIQKAIGWSLRQYSKTNSESVQTFLENHPEIDKLALREASKYL